MNFMDMIILGVANLWRTKLRTALTLMGVIIGIGALTSMVSFGTGMQKNITDSFAANDLFTSIRVSPKKMDLDALASGDSDQIMDSLKDKGTPLTDSTLAAIHNIPGVALAYPHISFAARIKLLNDSSSFNIIGLPAAISNFKPYNELIAGDFFATDTTLSAVVSEELLSRRFKIKLVKDDQTELSSADSTKGIKLMHPDSLIGQKIIISTMTVKPVAIPMALMGSASNSSVLPFSESITEVQITGILRSKSQFNQDMVGAGLILPMKTAENIPRVGFTSIWDLLDEKKKEGNYSSIQVKVADMKHMDEVKLALEAMDVGIFTIADQLGEIKRVFLIINAALGAIGTIALIVAGLGIINTMVMSILERTREIGIMKAIGGSENDIKLIFFTEAAVIGFLGGLLGLLLGWLVTKIANLVMNAQFNPDGAEPINLFYFPVWLILGAIAFSVLVSLAAGLYPAIRAARIDPVMALRHD